MGDRKQPQDGIRVDDLTWRERDVLNLLAEHMSNREIAERLFLAESSVKDYVRKILKKLNVKNRRQAVERAKELGILTRRSNLPAGLTPFIGRAGELEQIRQQLGKTRLLTLTGPGGVGKTRLALKTAEDASGDFRDGCFFVSLAPIRSVNHIVQSIAEAVNFRLRPQEDLKDQLLRYLRKKRFLLVMDNFEHLLDGAGIVSDILQNTPDVKILATSRERLNLQNETYLSIGGMQVGDRIDGIKNRDAVALFLQSAEKIHSEFDPAPGELAQIEEICTFVEGMPLAIELAASWLHVLSVSEVHAEMKKGLDILETEVRDAPERHRSIRAVFDHSWSLMEQAERDVFMRLSIFRGGFTREAAGQVAGASLKQLGGLVNKSILRHDPVAGRFGIHELLRQYAQEKLEIIPRASASTRQAYAAYYADFMQDRWEGIRGSRQIQALVEIEADFENERAAWGYYLDERNGGQLQKFIYSFLWVAIARGWDRRAVELFTDCAEALAPAEDDPDLQAVRGLAMAFQGFFMSSMTGPRYDLVKESIQILERFDRPVELAYAYLFLSYLSYLFPGPAEEKEAAQQALKIAEALDDQWLLGNVLWLLGYAEFKGGDYAEAKRVFEASLKLNTELDNTICIAFTFHGLGILAFGNEDIDEAKEYFLHVSRLSKTLNAGWLSDFAAQQLGRIALLTRELPEAERYLTQSLRSAYDLSSDDPGSERDVATLLNDFARLRSVQNRLEESVELLSLLLQQPSSHSYWSVGVGVISDHARALLSDLQGRLPREKYDVALGRGESLNLEEVILGLIYPKT